MFKKFLWKLFPPRYVSLEQVEQAHAFFENVRREKNYNPFYHDSDLDAAKKYYHDTVKRRINYEKYVRLQKST